jgi:hypothetical protein
MPLKLELGAQNEISSKRFSLCSNVSRNALPNIFEECGIKPGTGSATKIDTADSSNNTKNRVKTFYDYCQDDYQTTPQASNKLPYLQGLDTQIKNSIKKISETLTPT